MKRNRPRRPSTNMQPLGPTTPERASRFWNGWKETWAFLGPILTMISFVYFALPVITIEPSARTDPEQPYSTQFEIKNGGHIFPAYNVGFGCGFSITGPPKPGFFGFDQKKMKPPDSLGPGESFTRSCNPQASSGFIDEGSPLDVVVLYNYVPFIPWDKKMRFHFTVKHGSAGYFLVPDKR
jgi:hypothetical protein